MRPGSRAGRPLPGRAMHARSGQANLAFHGRMFWVVVVLVLAAALPFLGTLGNYFTGDDFAYVQLY